MKVEVAQGASRKSNLELLAGANHVVTNMTGNPYFASPDIVAQVNATADSATNMENAVNSPLSQTKTDSIKETREILLRNMGILANLVEAIANSNNYSDAQRAGIIHSAGMEVKGKTIRQKQVFSVSQGDQPGSVDLVAEAGARSHNWSYTSDIEKNTNRILLETTTGANTTVFGLTKFTTYAFFHQPVKPGVVSEWEGPLLFTVVK